MYPAVSLGKSLSEESSEAGDGDERKLYDVSNMSSDVEDASFSEPDAAAHASSAPPCPGFQIPDPKTRDTEDSDSPGIESETVDQLPHVQNDSESKTTLKGFRDSGYGSTHHQHSMSVPNGTSEGLVPRNEDERQFFGSSVGNSGSSYTRQSSLRVAGSRLGRSGSVRIVVVKAPPKKEEYVYQPFSFRQSTREQKILLAVMASVDFTSYMCLSILAPFFPDEVNVKG